MAKTYSSRAGDTDFDTPEADLVVMGAGLAGHRAALAAAQARMRVIVVEKMPTIDTCSTAMSGGSFAFAGTPVQERQGISDTSERLFEDLVEVGGGENEESLVRLYCERQSATFEWLQGLGVRFGEIQLSSGQSVPRSHPADPRDVLRRLHDEARRMGVRFLFDAPARRLLTASGKVTGLIAGRAGREMEIEARRGVVIASGGFSRSEKLLRDFVPDIRAALRAGGLGNEGDGILLAWRLGASVRDMGFVKGTFGSYIEVDPDRPHTTLLPIYRGAIAVNREGRRFVDEAKSYKTLGEACLKQPGARAFQIFDRTVMDAGIAGVPSFDFQDALARGRIVAADSIADLAAAITVPADALTATVAEYNEDAESGVDRAFGRSCLAHRFGSIRPLDSPPFYAYPCTTSINSTYAGLAVDERMRVLDVFGEAIEGLFAAGEVVGGFHGRAYMTGSSLVKALIFGEVAGVSAAQAPQ